MIKGALVKFSEFKFFEKLTDSNVAVLIWGITRLISWFPILTDFIFSLFNKYLWFSQVFLLLRFFCVCIRAWNFSQYLYFYDVFSVIIFQNRFLWRS